MKVSFTLTPDDYLAGHRLYRLPAPGAAREGPRLLERLFFFWFLLGAVVAVPACMIVASVVARAAGHPAGQRMMDWASAILLPSMMYLFVVGLLWFICSSFLTPRDRRDSRRSMLLYVATLIAYQVISTVITGPAPADAKSAPGAAPAGESEWGTFFAALVPWLLMMVFVILSFRRFLNRAVLRNWEQQPHLSRPQTLELTPHGLRLDDGWCARDYRWEGLLKWRESDALFLLYPSEIAFHVVPKRAFASSAEVDGFRAMLQQHVRAVDAQPQGFAVQQPAGAQPPLPPPPLPVPARPL